MTLADLKNAVAHLMASDSARGAKEFKAELDAIKASVDGALSDAIAKVEDVSKALLATQAESKGFKDRALAAESSLLSLNEDLTTACLEGGVGLRLDLPADAAPEAKREKALALPVADKWRAYQASLNAAFLKANVPRSAMPSVPAQAPAADGARKKLTMAQFRELTPAQASAFCAAVLRREAELVEDPAPAA